MKKITKQSIEKFKIYLTDEEKSKATLEKYTRDVTAFAEWLADADLDKGTVLRYKQRLIENYAPASVNSIISSINSFFAFNEWFELRVKALKIQKRIFADKDRELGKNEYERLLAAARKKKNKRLYYLMQTICSTGIRISELKYITVQAVMRGQAAISCKGKMRIVFLPPKLCKILKKYISENKIKAGSVFVSKNGIPLNRSNVWSDMKKLCAAAGVSGDKVFPHNLRHLFARTYYSLQKDVVRLADILGHSSVNTTRIYTMECGDVHRKQIQKLGLLLCTDML